MYFTKVLSNQYYLQNTTGLKLFFNTAQGLSLSILKRPVLPVIPGGGVLGLIFTGYVPLASKSPYSPLQSILWPIMDPILVTFGQIYNPHSHFTRNYCFFTSSKWEEAIGDVPLDGVTFSWLDWLYWDCIFNRVTRMGSHIFGFWGVKQFFTFTVSKRTRMFVL